MAQVRIRKSQGGMRLEAEIVTSPSSNDIVITSNYKVLDPACSAGTHDLWIGSHAGGPIKLHIDGATHQGSNTIRDVMPSGPTGWYYQIEVQA